MRAEGVVNGGTALAEIAGAFGGSGHRIGHCHCLRHPQRFIIREKKRLLPDYRSA